MLKRKKLFLILLLLIIIAGASILLISLKQKTDHKQETTQGKPSEIQKLAQAINTDPKYQDKNSQEYKDAREHFCDLIARPASEQAKAVKAIQSFLDQPDAKVEYRCSQFKKADYDDKPETERYFAEGRDFVINISTNHVVDAVPPQGIWNPNKKTTKTYAQSDLEKRANEFIEQHTQSLGVIDLNKFKLITSTKNKETYLFRWLLNGCSFGNPECKYVEIVYSKTGEIIRYSSTLES